MLRSNLCDNNDVYIVVKGTIDLLAAATNGNEKHRKMLRVKLTLNLGLDGKCRRFWYSHADV